MQNRQGEDGPGITVLGPEALQEMGIKIGVLVPNTMYNLGPCPYSSGG